MKSVNSSQCLCFSYNIFNLSIIFMLLQFLMNSALAPLPILAHLLTNQHSTNSLVICIQQRAVGILKDCMGAYLWYVETPLYSPSKQKRIHRH